MTKKSAPRNGSRRADDGLQPAPALSKVTNICLSQLALSPANVRKTPATAAEDAELEASIRAKGILQNLIVHGTSIGGRTVYEVDAGGRRLKTLQKLAAEGVIDGDHPVPCLVREPDTSVETSLMENTVRAAMHPADEFVAMAELTDAGVTIDDVAARFGVSKRHVKQRLRLGKLAPELLDAYRAGDIDLETVTAFTLGADHAAQLAVWNQVKGQSYISPHRVRHLLTDSAISLDSALGQFVGKKAYKAAGGTITEDLFTGDNDGYMSDAALVRQLAIAKLETKAQELQADWAWTKAVLDPEYRVLQQYARVEPKPAKIPAELSSEIERIEQRLGELEDIEGDAFTDELMQEATALEERRTEIDEIIEGLAVYTKKDRKRAGCIVTIGEGGEFCLHQGLIDRAAMRAADAAADERDGFAGSDDEEFEPDQSSGDDEDGISRPSTGAEQALRKELGFSQSLVDDLKAHRVQITRAHLAENFEVAFDLALYTLCVDLLERYGYRLRPLDLHATENQPLSSLNDLAGTGADGWLATEQQVLELDWLKLPAAQGFAALAALPLQEKQRLFAWCIAASLKPQLAIENRADPVLEATGRRLGIGFEDYWRPTAANYWGRVKKAHSLAIGAEILGDRWARDHADDKKPLLAAALETAFDPQKSSACVSLTQAARDAAAAWLPPGMAYCANAVDASADPGHDGTADDGAETDTGAPSADLPDFLTADGPTAVNGATAH
jgi:ParB family chromosome partitioning protein